MSPAGKRRPQARRASTDAILAARKIYPDRQDPIRIVPLYDPSGAGQPTAEAAAAAPATPPQLTYRNGPLLTAVEVVTVFWGAAWQQAQLPLVDQINGFFDFILKSTLITQLAEYSVAGKQIGFGTRVGFVTITTPALRASVSDTAVRHMLQQEISTSPSMPPPTPQTLYFVYLPPGVRVLQGGAASCQSFCGYHSDISGQVFYAVMPYPGCKGCTGGLSVFDALTTTSSHELSEAITDPIPGRGWYDDANGEIGDICAWKTKKLGPYTVQLEWSNRANACK